LFCCCDHPTIITETNSGYGCGSEAVKENPTGFFELMGF
jgi:hypothetical protein